MLELPDQRAAAAERLLAMGGEAVPAIEAALLDPRPDFVQRLLLVLRELGEPAKATLPRLRRLAQEDDPALAFAGRWGVSLFERGAVTLLADRENGRLVELDHDGKQVWTLGDQPGVFSAERLPNGRYLVALPAAMEVREVDRDGKVHWRYRAKKSPQFARRLANGNTLVCTGWVDESAFEVDPAGKVVWSFGPGPVWAACRLADGTTLVPHMMRREIRIVDATRTVVRRIPSLRGITGVQMTRRGTILTCPHGKTRLQEIDLDGKVVRERKLPGKPHRAMPLPDGGVAVAGEGFAALYGAAAEPLWQRRGDFGTAFVY